MFYRILSAGCLAYWLLNVAAGGLAAERVQFEYSGTWRSIDIYPPMLNGRSFEFKMAVDVDAVPSDTFNSPNVVGYAAASATLHIDGVPVPVVNSRVFFVDGIIPGEPDRWFFSAPQAVVPGSYGTGFFNVVELAPTTFTGIRPQTFRADQILEFPNAWYDYSRHCSVGEPCIERGLQMNFLIENPAASGRLVPEPTTVLNVLVIFGVTALRNIVERRSRSVLNSRHKLD
jgi:hypothetical protein